MGGKFNIYLFPIDFWCVLNLLFLPGILRYGCYVILFWNPYKT